MPDASPDAATEARDASVPGACTIAPGCLDINVPPLNYVPCCTAKLSCGYVLPPLSAETLQLFPQAKDFFAMVVKDDPNGRCAPESFFFDVQDGLNEERWEEEGVEDILIASTCSAFHIAAFAFAGCCLPDNTCGLSTHAYWSILETLSGDSSAPFARPECVPPEVLNQQLRDSSLASLARTRTTGSCNYAEIAARQPNRL